MADVLITPGNMVEGIWLDNLKAFKETVSRMPVQEAAETLAKAFEEKAETLARDLEEKGIVESSEYSEAYIKQELLKLENLIKVGLDAMGAVLDNRRGGEGQPLNLESKEMAAIAEMLESLRKTIPIFKLHPQGMVYLSCIMNDLSALLNPELVQMLSTLIGDFLCSLDKDGLDYEILKVSFYLVERMPVKMAAEVLARFVEENPLCCVLPKEVLGTMIFVLDCRRERDNMEDTLTCEEYVAIFKLFRSFQMKLSCFVNADTIGLLYLRLRSLIARYPNLKIIGTDLIQQVLLNLDLPSEPSEEYLELMGLIASYEGKKDE